MEYQLQHIILKPLSLKEAGAYYALYATLYPGTADSPFHEGEHAEQFTQRIINACNCIYGIYSTAQPAVLIGDCALHHWNEPAGTIEFGAALHPHYQGKGLITEALTQLCNIAKTSYKAHILIGKTSPDNKQAVHFVLKNGFTLFATTATELIFSKTL